ncbi:hypothetical protein GCM10020256_02890 [Streptomyces thermocoprophilus]
MGACSTSERGSPAGPEDLVDVARLVTAYYTLHPDPSDPGQRVAFGTSGHRGSSLATAFNDDHIAATSQAICEYRAAQGTDGPLFLGADTHALSEPARATALEVFAANDVTVLVDTADGWTPTPAVSHAILTHNRGRTSGLADGVVVTPSHNPPADGGFKYNPPSGGPAGSDATSWIQNRANEIIAAGPEGRTPHPVHPGPRRTHHRPLRLPRHVRRRPARPSSTSTRSAPPACASAPTRSAAPPWRTGAGSPSSTGST